MIGSEVGGDGKATLNVASKELGASVKAGGSKTKAEGPEQDGRVLADDGAAEEVADTETAVVVEAAADVIDDFVVDEITELDD